MAFGIMNVTSMICDEAASAASSACCNYPVSLALAVRVSGHSYRFNAQLVIQPAERCSHFNHDMVLSIQVEPLP